MRRPSRTASRRPTLWTAALTGSAVAIALGLPTLPAGAAPAPAPDPSGPRPPPRPAAPTTPASSSPRRRPRGSTGASPSPPAARPGPTGPPPRRSATPARGSPTTTSTAPTSSATCCGAWATTCRCGSPTTAAFPTDDCRNDLGLTEVTNKQVNSFVDEFSTKMYPRESKVFSVPPDRNGADSAAADIGLDADYWTVPRKQADDIVVLVDNVRDSNYYAPGHPRRPDLHRRLLLELLQRAGRPQHHDDRRLRLDPPHRREPARQQQRGRLRGLRRGARPADDQLRHLPAA